MSEIQNSKKFDLEDRTLEFARRCRGLMKQLPKTVGNFEDSKQLIRASGSVHLNFIEASEALSKKDFYYRVRICRKEAKESRSCLRLIDCEGLASEKERDSLIQEATELTRIFGSIIEKGK